MTRRFTTHEANGEKGIILPGETVKVEDGFTVKVDPSHLS